MQGCPANTLRDGSDDTLQKYKEAAAKVEKNTSPTDISGGMMMDHDEGDAKTTQGNPGTPATATMSASSATSASSSSSASASQSNAARKLHSRTAPYVFPALAGLCVAGGCGYLT
jgi:hypothetical protein